MHQQDKCQSARSLTEIQEKQFLHSGFAKLENAFPARAVAEETCAILWRESGCDPINPATWTRPVVRIGDCAQEPFRKAANTPALHAAFYQLVGAGRWIPRESLGGFPIRFPHRGDPGDTGWHADDRNARQLERPTADERRSPQIDIRLRKRNH